MGLLAKNKKNMPYGPTCTKIKICLMGLLTKNKNMPYGPTYKITYALWAYLQTTNILLSHELICVTK